MLIKNVISENFLQSDNAAPHLQYGFFEWNIEKDQIIFCPHIIKTLAFDITSTTQNYAAWRKLTHPDDIEQAKLEFKRIKEKQTLYAISETRKLCRDGEWRWFSIRGKIIDFDDDGNPIYVVGTCTDVSKIKEAELKLKQMEFLFDEINQVKICYEECTKDDEAIHQLGTKICQSFEKLTHATCSILVFSLINNLNKKEPSFFDVNGRNIKELNLSQEKHNFLKIVAEAEKNIIQNNDQISFLGIHFSLPFKQQGILIIERNEPFDENILKDLHPLIGTANYILSIKKLETNRSELDNMISFFIKQVPVPVAMFDKNMCYKFASDAWMNDFNLSHHQSLIGKSCYELSPTQPKEWRDRHQRAMNGEILVSAAEEIVDYFDQAIWLEGAIHPWYTLNGEIGGIIIYSNVVTDRKENEKNLKNIVENLIRSNQSLERFAHVCSHDLKEPLRSISNFIQLLFTRNSEHFDEESLIYMRHTLKGIDRMSSLIKDILLYSKINGQESLDKTIIDTNSVINDIKEKFNYSLSEIGALLDISELPVIFRRSSPDRPAFYQPY